MHGTISPSRMGGHYDIDMDDTGGVSLRDYFAAHAINSLKLRINTSDIKMLNVSEVERDEKYSILAPLHARYAYAIADAMLAERSKKESD